MRLILTHEQADFDALASQVGGYLLDDTCLPVLPRRINRNGRAFLNLYSSELPFIKPDDLPEDAIESILLVDTQSLVTLKGMGKTTQVRVIDHHKLRSDLPTGWQFSGGSTGACATLLIEQLQETNPPLTVPLATLLLLGIYEDTGSLTYASTTPRDVRAAAFLLENGADLRILAEFLNPPLSTEQRKVYELLLKSVETFTIQGQSIMVAQADAGGMDDEISTVAHKLRDLLDPDALFLLVSTNEGVRLVARSTTDRVNVAEITAALGGGGHERAASALRRKNSANNLPDDPGLLARMRQDLLDLLPIYVQPSISVGQIMSRRPRLLTPETSLQEAAQLMQRYGYEGYPVVKDGQVVGLLTRRAVDKAVAHHLNLNTGSLMEGGQFQVSSTDAIQQLQQVMATSGWGQVPVVDPAVGEIIGIVTRTDLLKSLSQSHNRSNEDNLASRLEKVMPAPKLALLKAIANQAFSQHIAVYIVGGFVRDLLLEHPSQDFDVVVEGDAIALSHSLAGQFGGRAVTHSHFGTAKWHIREDKTHVANCLGLPEDASLDDLPESLDLVSARSEYYDHPSALPTVERGSIKADLLRRDFTINTLALRLDGRHYGELHDYFGGYKDLHNGQVRVLHSLSFVDDPTRLLRAVRFEQRFGFEIEPRTLDLVRDALPQLKHLGGERLHHEFDLIFDEPHAAAMMARLKDLGILAAIDSSLPWDEFTARLLPFGNLAEVSAEWGLAERISGVPMSRALAYLVWLARLAPENIQRVYQCLKLAGGLCEALVSTNKLLQNLPGLQGQPPSLVTAHLEAVPFPTVYAAYLLTDEEPLRLLLRSYTTLWRHTQALSDGNTLRARGLAPSPVFSEILKTLRAAWLDGLVHDAQEEDALLDTLIKQWKLPPG